MNEPVPHPPQPATLRGAIEAKIKWLDEEIRTTNAAAMQSDDEHTCIINRSAENVLREWRSNLSALLEVGEEGPDARVALARLIEAVDSRLSDSAGGPSLKQDGKDNAGILIDALTIARSSLLHGENALAVCWSCEEYVATEDGFCVDCGEPTRFIAPPPPDTGEREERCPRCKCKRENPRGSMDVPCDHPFHTPKRCPTCKSDNPAQRNTRHGIAGPASICDDPFHTLPDRDEEGR